MRIRCIVLHTSFGRFEESAVIINDRLAFLIRFLSLSPGWYTHTIPIRVFVAQRGRDFEAPDLERGIHFRGVF